MWGLFCADSLGINNKHTVFPVINRGVTVSSQSLTEMSRDAHGELTEKIKGASNLVTISLRVQRAC